MHTYNPQSHNQWGRPLLVNRKYTHSHQLAPRTQNVAYVFIFKISKGFYCLMKPFGRKQLKESWNHLLKTAAGHTLNRKEMSNPYIRDDLSQTCANVSGFDSAWFVPLNSSSINSLSLKIKIKKDLIQAPMFIICPCAKSVCLNMN